MKKIFSVFLLLPLFLMVSCANKTSVRHRNDYAKTLKHSRGITVLPVKAEVNMVSVTGKKERMYDYEYAIEEAIFKEAKPILKKKGYKVSMLNKRNLKDKSLFSNYELLYEGLEKETSELYKEPLMNVERAYNIENKVGMHAMVVGRESRGDVLFLVNYLNNIQDNGARALNVAMFVFSAAVGSTNSGHLDGTDNAGILLSMVDAKNGNVLWCNHFFTSSGMMHDMFRGDSKEVDKKRIDQLLSGALKTLPNKHQLLDKVAEAA